MEEGSPCPKAVFMTTTALVLEGEGVAPDIEVWDDPNILVQGRDPQVERVVEEVLKSLKANPPRKTPAPPLEDRTSKGLKVKK